MVQNYTADIKHALWSLQATGSIPPFPKSEWKHILTGTVVKLDVVFSGLFSTLMEDKITATIGEFDFSIGGAKPSKVIQSHGDWTIRVERRYVGCRLCVPTPRKRIAAIFGIYHSIFRGLSPLAR